MRWLIRTFFRTVRRIIGPVLLLVDKLTTPRGVVRSDQEQARLDERTRHLELYQFKTCPFCIKVRREIKRQSLNIEFRDAQNNAEVRKQLVQDGGKLQVPCLKVSDTKGEPTWIYESSEVINYLRKLVA